MIATNEELKPCPLCGGYVRMTEFMARPYDMYTEFSAIIECDCGLTFERDWTAGRGVIFDEDIVTLWNERKNGNV